MRAGVNVKAVFFYTLLGNLDLCTWMVFGLEKSLFHCQAWISRFSAFVWTRCPCVRTYEPATLHYLWCLRKTNNILVTVSKAAALISAEKSLIHHANLQLAAFPSSLPVLMKRWQVRGAAVKIGEKWRLCESQHDQEEEVTATACQ